MPHKGNTSRVDYRPSDRLVHAYFANVHALDRYILKYLYDSYNKDSIPQMVNVRLLKSLIREHLDNKDLCGPYMMSLHDYQGRTLYEYIPPSDGQCQAMGRAQYGGAVSLRADRWL